jgi:NADH-quinone oxidoreductase subunit J
MVLFIFTILLINVVQAQFLRQFHGQRPLAGILVVALLAETVFLLLSNFRGNFPLMQDPPPEAAGKAGLEILAHLLLTDYLLLFEVASVLLLAALIGAVVLARGNLPSTDRQQ